MNQKSLEKSGGNCKDEALLASPTLLTDEVSSSIHSMEGGECLENGNITSEMVLNYILFSGQVSVEFWRAAFKKEDVKKALKCQDPNCLGPQKADGKTKNTYRVKCFTCGTEKSLKSFFEEKKYHHLTRYMMISDEIIIEVSRYVEILEKANTLLSPLRDIISSEIDESLLDEDEKMEETIQSLKEALHKKNEEIILLKKKIMEFEHDKPPKGKKNIL